MIRTCAWLAVAGVFLTVAGAAESTVSFRCTPALPLPNLVRNGGFETGELAPWQAIKGSAEAVVLEAATGAGDSRGSIRITASSELKAGAFQRVALPAGLPAGSPLYIRFAARKKDADLDRKPAGVALQLRFADKSSAYQPMPLLPVEDYDWLEIDKVVELGKAGAESGSLYLCHYEQTGEQWFDDVLLQAGNVQLELGVANPDGLARVRLWSSHEGLVYDSRDLPAGTCEFSKAFAVPGYATYYAEVNDRAGGQTGGVYPADGQVNVPAGVGVWPLGGLGRLTLTSETPFRVVVDLPEKLAAPPVHLLLAARLQSSQLAGHTAALQVTVNGKTTGAAELRKPSNALTTASGKESVISTNRGYVTYYSPAFFALSVENTYCPVSEPDRNPFLFRIDVSQLLQPGRNVIELACTARSPKGPLLMVLEQPRLVLAE